VSNWAYVTIAYLAVWGGLAVYAVILARRVTQAKEVADALRDALEQSPETPDQESAACDTPPVP
jgi:CcmD family protein